MQTITEQVEEILDKRLGRGIYDGHGRLQKIEAHISTLATVREKIEQLDALVSTISKQIETFYVAVCFHRCDIFLFVYHHRFSLA
ncbi:hypothetical protein [Xylanibacter rodentium]|uniref:Uncharacterized protein n=1 Tax=Xylanibacter rodentium TaxID=2736289 RepID=A0ABX2AUG3_9BACT|nr:hypothetical protein [Xylanibacter rodentium]NPE11146.1 hypothetical protein [Prevotella sp. PJ1A]NPE13295.1 hypothetical protein [Xylanibacter rodentium]NPE39063.1 hypothetical protein [Prevotella sp. PCJ2]